MHYMPKALMASVFVPALLLTAGCATREEVDTLRSEVSAMRADLNETKSAAMRAAEAAERAAAEAKAANQKADEIYRQSLRK